MKADGGWSSAVKRLDRWPLIGRGEMSRTDDGHRITESMATDFCENSLVKTDTNTRITHKRINGGSIVIIVITKARLWTYGKFAFN